MMSVQLNFTAVAIALAFAASGCSTTPAADAQTGGSRANSDCAVVADIAGQLKGDNFDPMVGGRDCRAEFAAAGLPMQGLRKPNDPEDAPGKPYIVRFQTPERQPDGTVRLRISFTCPRLCGHGEEVIAEPQSGRWVITKRKTTWMS